MDRSQNKFHMRIHYSEEREEKEVLPWTLLVEMIQKFGGTTEDGWAAMALGVQKPRKKRRAMDLLKHRMVIVLCLR